MHPISCALLSLSLLSTAALGAEPPVATPQKPCRAHIESQVQTVQWSGECKDGIAEGTGEMRWRGKEKFDLLYKGGMKAGRYHGVGYERKQDNTQYEGEFVDGVREGFGIELDHIENRYDGNWKAGKMDGQGKIVYAVGGSYEGGWREGKFHGKGTIVYPGGRRANYDFVDGAWPDQIVAPKSRQAFHLRYSNAPHTSISPDDIPFKDLKLPPHYGYEQMTAQQKSLIASSYPLMDPADEPPYPLKGTKRVLQTLADIEAAGNGKITVLVTVGPDGEAQSVKTIGSPSERTTKIVQYAYMLEKFKSAKCAGKPCTMIYPMIYVFEGHYDEL